MKIAVSAGGKHSETLFHLRNSLSCRGPISRCRASPTVPTSARGYGHNQGELSEVSRQYGRSVWSSLHQQRHSNQFTGQLSNSYCAYAVLSAATHLLGSN